MSDVQDDTVKLQNWCCQFPSQPIQTPNTIAIN